MWTFTPAGELRIREPGTDTYIVIPWVQLQILPTKKVMGYSETDLLSFDYDRVVVRQENCFTDITSDSVLHSS